MRYNLYKETTNILSGFLAIIGFVLLYIALAAPRIFTDMMMGIVLFIESLIGRVF